MQIAFLNPQGNFDPQDSYWTEHPDFGGQLVYVKELALAIAAQGHQVDILTRQIRDERWPEFRLPVEHYPEESAARIVRLPCGPDQFLVKEELWPHLGDWVSAIEVFYQNENAWPDFFTGHYADGGLAGVLLKQHRGTPFTFTGHSLGAQKMDKLGVNSRNMAELDERYKFSRRLAAERVCMRWADIIVTSTHQEREQQYGHTAYADIIAARSGDPFAVIPPGVNRRVFSPQPAALDEVISNRILEVLARDIESHRREKAVILASSRLDPKKNHMGLMQAFALDAELQQMANLMIVVRGVPNALNDFSALDDGEAAIMHQIVNTIMARDLQGKVSAISLESQLELAAAYRTLARRGSVFCLTALYEPFGLAPLEAMSCGLPAVVTRNGGPSESLRSDTQDYGELVDPASPADIARGLKRILASGDTWQAYQRAGIQRVQARYTWERTAETYLNRMQISLDGLPSPAIELADIPACLLQPVEETDFSLRDLARWYFPGSEDS